jgi:hypothetical protein
MKTRFKNIAMLAAIGVAGLVLAPQANATVQITLTNGASTVTVIDGGAGDSCAAVNCVTFNGALGNYIVNVSTGFSNLNGVNPFLDLNSINVAPNANAGLLTIKTSQTGYTFQSPQFQLSVGGTSSLGGASSFAAYGGNSNTIFDTSHQIGSLTFPSRPYSAVATGGGNTVNPYSLTLVATLNGLTAGVASFDAELSSVPEPASMALLGAVLLFTGTAFRRKLRRTV